MIPIDPCTNCTQNGANVYSVCPEENFYNFQNYVAFSSNTTDVQIQGKLGTTDDFYLGDALQLNTPILAVSTYNMTNQTWWNNEFQMYGSISCGRPTNLSDPSSNSLLALLFQQGKIDQGVWSIWPWEIRQGNFYIIFGWCDYVLEGLTNQVWWTPSPVDPQDPNKWSVDLSNLYLSLDSDTSLFNSTSTYSAAFSTGYQYIGLPSLVWQAMCSEISNFVQNQHVGGAACTTNNVNHMLSITSIGSSLSTIPPLHYNTFGLQMKNDQGQNVRYDMQLWQSGWWGQNVNGTEVFMLPFQDIGPNATQIVIGQAFMSTFITIFDSDNQRLGLASYKYSPQTWNDCYPWECGSLGPWIYFFPVAELQINLGGWWEPRFLMQTYLGSNSQLGMLVVANDLQGLLTPSDLCLEECTAYPFFNPTNSTSFIYSSSGNYTDWPVSAYVETDLDQVCLASALLVFPTSFCMSNVTINLVENYSMINTTYAANEFLQNGLLGFGRPSTTFNSTNTTYMSVLSFALQQGYAYSTTWSLYYADSDHQFKLAFGVPPQFFRQTFDWQQSPITPSMPDSWFTRIQFLAIGSHVIFSTNQPQSLRAQFVTGYPFIGLNTTVWNQVCDALQKSYQDGCVICDSSVTSLPYLLGDCEIVEVGDVMLQFDTWNLLGFQVNSQMQQNSPGEPTFWPFENIGDSSVVLVGAPFFLSYNTIFDNEAAQLGFAPNDLGSAVWTNVYSAKPPSFFVFNLILTGGYVFTIDMLLGTPIQQGRIMLANDQQGIYTSFCSGCDSSSYFYDFEMSSTAVYDGGDTVWDTACVTSPFSDSIGYTSLCLENALITLKGPPVQPIDEYQFNGMLGLGRTGHGFIEGLQAQGFISSMRWTYVPNADTSQAGQLYFGGFAIDIELAVLSDYIAEQICEVDPNKPDSWTLPISTLAIGQVLVLKESDKRSAEFITGYLNIGFDSLVWNEVCRSLSYAYGFQDIQSSPIVCNANYSTLPFALGTCSNFAEAGTKQITFRFTSQDYITIADRLLLIDGLYDNEDACFWRFENIGDYFGILVGQPFLQQFVTLFDIDAGILGFGVGASNLNAATLGPWISSTPTFELPPSLALPTTFTSPCPKSQTTQAPSRLRSELHRRMQHFCLQTTCQSS